MRFDGDGTVRTSINQISEFSQRKLGITKNLINILSQNFGP